jgi:hypothetical protein
LETIPQDAANWRISAISAGRSASLASSLASYRKEVLLYRKLAALREDVPLKENLSDLEWLGAHKGLKELCSEWGETKLPLRITRWNS